MKFRLLVVITILILGSASSVFSQEGIPCDSLKASVSCESAPIICDLNCLDGFNARMPDTLNTADSIRNVLCPAFGGQPSNMSWFAFVAGSTTIELRVLLDNCVKGVQAELGVQSAIYTTCDLPPSGKINANDVLDCYAPTVPNINDFTLFSDQFVIGQVYYFFIDGYSGTVCDYEIEVLQGAQPFPLDELGALVSKDSIPADTVCLGHKNYLLRPSISELDIDYFWKMTPATPDYPDTFRLLGYNTFWKFNYPGDYQVSVYATNGCDITDTLTQNITVMPLGKEVFDTVAVCFNDFPFAGPLTEDPNGDGVIGWLGPMIQYNGGQITHDVTISTSGCKYTQEVYVDEISPKPRANVSIYSCQPFDYNGTMITQSVQNLNITLAGQTARGCDSMVSLNATIVDLQGNIGVINCDNGGLNIGFTSSAISAPPGYTLSYKWFDSTQELVDNDNVEGDIIITKRDFYRVEITMYFGQDSCIFDIPAELIDPDDTRPQITAEDWTLNICSDDNIGTYKITSDQPTKIINWTIPAGATYVSGNTNSTEIMVDFTNSGSGIIAVSVENFCSGVSTIDFPIEIVETPKANYDLPIEVCRETEVLLLAVGNSNPDFQYVWKIPSQAIITAGSLNSSGPINIEFTGISGTYPIELIISNGNCRDTLVKNIVVLPDVPMLNVQCDQQANSVTFSWDAEGCADSYSIIQNGITIATISETTYTFENLPINTTIDAEILINSNCMCKGSTTAVNCSSLDCNDIEFSITPTQNFICENAWISDLLIFISVKQGNTSQGTFTWSGDYISNLGVFDAIAAGAGVHNINLVYEKDGCVYQADTSIVLLENPSGDLQVFDPQCIDDLFGSLQISAQGGDGNYTYLLDNTNVTENVSNIAIGDHTIQIIDGNSCQVIKTFTIDPTPIITYNIEGLTEIYESDIMNIALNYTMSEVSLIDSISWFINGELYCSSLECAKVTLANLTPGEYEHTIFIYYNDCVIEESYFVLVKETSKVFVPQIFSPNNDGNNDYWFIATNDPNLVFNNVSIFNRWGNKVFSKEKFFPASEPELWDGTFNGNKVQPGVYVLLVEYVDEFGVNKLIKKDITVIY